MKTPVQKYVGQLRWILLVGIAVSFYLLLLHFRYEQLGGVCEIGKLFSCSVLLIKDYSLWFQIPVPVFSIIFYLISFSLSWYAYKHHDKELIQPYLYLWVLSIVAILSTIGMAYIAFIKLKTICIFCSLLYITSILYVVWMFKIFGTEDHPWFFHLSHMCKNFYRNTKVLLVVVSSVVILVFAHFFFKQPESNFSLDSTQVMMGRSAGNPQAINKVEVFSDFQCPACKSASPFLYELERELGSKIFLTYKYFPLDSACNPSIRRSMHPQACQAARASFCASVQNKFWRYHDLLFANQMNLNDSIYVDLAKSENLNIQEFMTCFQSDESQRAVESDVAQGNMYLISATPTIMLNGKPYTGKRTIDDFRQALQNP
ncbi:MAG: thioredoxin domain-containing protein [Bdellovibrionales bacterium]|nr:thioredoxin domain-containing protein [Bdellovibrionales bacterium]